MVDCGFGKRDYFGRIMRSRHRVNSGSWEKRADKRMENIPLKIAMVSGRGLGKTILHQNKTHHSSHWVQGASVTMVPSPGSPFHVCQDWGGRETRNILVSPAIGAEADMGACAACTHSQPSGFKMLYADGGSSHNMNHLVTRAELEMSRLISVPHASVALHHLHLRQWRKRDDLIKERSWDFRCRHLLHWETAVYISPHRIICNTDVLFKIGVCCAGLSESRAL